MGCERLELPVICISADLQSAPLPSMDTNPFAAQKKFRKTEQLSEYAYSANDSRLKYELTTKNYIVGNIGLEPIPTEPKSVVLPLHQSPILFLRRQRDSNPQAVSPTSCFQDSLTTSYHMPPNHFYIMNKKSRLQKPPDLHKQGG